MSVRGRAGLRSLIDRGEFRSPFYHNDACGDDGDYESDDGDVGHSEGARGGDGEQWRGGARGRVLLLISIKIRFVKIMMITCITGITLLVGITGKPFLSSTTDVTS